MPKSWSIVADSDRKKIVKECLTDASVEMREFDASAAIKRFKNKVQMPAVVEGLQQPTHSGLAAPASMVQGMTPREAMAHAAASHKHSATERARARSEATLYSAYQTKMFSRRYMHPSPGFASHTATSPPTNTPRASATWTLTTCCCMHRVCCTTTRRSWHK